MCVCVYLLSVDTAVMLRAMCTSEGGRRAKSRDDLRVVTAPAGDFSDMTTRRSLQRLRNPPNRSRGGGVLSSTYGLDLAQTHARRVQQILTRRGFDQSEPSLVSVNIVDLGPQKKNTV